jgi:hypothetical protein
MVVGNRRGYGSGTKLHPNSIPPTAKSLIQLPFLKIDHVLKKLPASLQLSVKKKHRRGIVAQRQSKAKGSVSIVLLNKKVEH